MNINKKILFLILGLSLHGAVRSMEKINLYKIIDDIKEFDRTHDVNHLTDLSTCLTERRKNAGLEEWIQFIYDIELKVNTAKRDLHDSGIENNLLDTVIDTIHRIAFRPISPNFNLLFSMSITIETMHKCTLRDYNKPKQHIIDFIRSNGDVTHMQQLAMWLAEKRKTCSTHDLWKIDIRDINEPFLCRCFNEKKEAIALKMAVENIALKLQPGDDCSEELVKRAQEALNLFSK